MKFGHIFVAISGLMAAATMSFAENTREVALWEGRSFRSFEIKATLLFPAGQDSIVRTMMDKGSEIKCQVTLPGATKDYPRTVSPGRHFKLMQYEDREGESVSMRFFDPNRATNLIVSCQSDGSFVKMYQLEQLWGDSLKFDMIPEQPAAPVEPKEKPPVEAIRAPAIDDGSNGKVVSKDFESGAGGHKNAKASAKGAG